MPSKRPNLAVSAPDNAEIYTVSRLNREARRLLESGLARVWIAGEISNLARPASGHIYFTLKDAGAQVRCAMFRAANNRLTFRPENGSQVLVRAKVSIYEPRGDYQLIVDQLEDAGEGLLRRKFEELKVELDQAGLFDAARKQSIPSLPSAIGVVTSPSGAAIRDILNILGRRYPAATVIIYPTRVQGDGAGDEIVAAIRTAVERNEVDVLIIARGGGSLEDLWAFNEEHVARAVFDCSLPTISGVGHEVDVTITDLVADVRAPTPSGAAELVVPDQDELLRNLHGLTRRAALSLQSQVAAQLRLQGDLAHRLKLNHPGTVIEQAKQLADDLTARLTATMQDHLDDGRAARTSLMLRLRNATPEQKIAHLKELLTVSRRRLLRETQQQLESAKARFRTAAAGLNTVSPLATLERGYAIVSDADTQSVIRDAGELTVGANIGARLAVGEIEASVTKIKKRS